MLVGDVIRFIGMESLVMSPLFLLFDGTDFCFLLGGGVIDFVYFFLLLIIIIAGVYPILFSCIRQLMYVYGWSMWEGSD